MPQLEASHLGPTTPTSIWFPTKLRRPDPIMTARWRCRRTV